MLTYNLYDVLGLDPHYDINTMLEIDAEYLFSNEKQVNSLSLYRDNHRPWAFWSFYRISAHSGEDLLKIKEWVRSTNFVSGDEL